MATCLPDGRGVAPFALARQQLRFLSATPQHGCPPFINFRPTRRFLWGVICAQLACSRAGALERVVVPLTPTAAARFPSTVAQKRLLDTPQPPSPPPPPRPLATGHIFTCCSEQMDTCNLINDAIVCAALGELYYATNGGGWVHNSGWSAAATGYATDFCSFYGATCTDGVLQNLCVRERAALTKRMPSAHTFVRLRFTRLVVPSHLTVSAVPSRRRWAT